MLSSLPCPRPSPAELFAGLIVILLGEFIFAQLQPAHPHGRGPPPLYFFPSLLILYAARAGRVAFRIHVPRVSEDLRKVWRDFLSSYAHALKAKHGLPITVEDIEGEDWVEIVVRTV